MNRQFSWLLAQQNIAFLRITFKLKLVSKRKKASTAAGVYREKAVEKKLIVPEGKYASIGIDFR